MEDFFQLVFLFRFLLQHFFYEFEVNGIHTLAAVVFFHHKERGTIHLKLRSQQHTGAGWVTLIGHQYFIDTGHLAYAGTDPVETLRRYWDRVDYIHFKDIDPTVFDQVMAQKIRFFDACAKGVMCPIGRGNIDYPAVRALLSELGYGGYITIEQERDPQNAGSILDDLAASRTFLKQTGF